MKPDNINEPVEVFDGKTICGAGSGREFVSN
jgi:hypothetical protein